jgi:hypothetical protein
LAYYGTYLYCGIYGSNGDEVYQIDPATGAYSLLFDNGPQGDAYGLTYDGMNLWTTDHPSDPAVAMRLDWDGTLLGQFDLPTRYMSGIAYDNGDFWVAQYYPDPSHIYLVDDRGAILDDFPAPDNQPWDLCIENGKLWMADYWGDTLYQIDPSTGDVVESHASEGTDPAGIVWDGTHLWYCDNGEGGVDYLYKVDLSGTGTPQINIPVDAHEYGAIAVGSSATWNMTVQNTGDADLSISGVSFAPTDDLSCPATFPVVIPPSGSDQLPLVFAPDDFNPLAATASILSNDPVHPAEPVTLTGHGVYPDPYIDVTEATHDYGAVRLNATTRWFMEISNHGNQLLTINDILIDDPRFYLDEAVSLPIQIATLASVEIGVWFSPDSAASFTATVTIDSNDPAQNPTYVGLDGSGVLAQYPMGQELWSYSIYDPYDASVKAIAPIPDVSGDGVGDVIVCSEDDYIRCFNGNAHGTGDVLWEHEIYAGSVFSQNALAINEDVNTDGYHDVVVGSAWGGRLIRTLSGKTGEEIWTYDTREYGDGGWVYDVDCRFDYNGDGIADVLASTGDDSTDTGPKRIYCLNGVTGTKIWESPQNGPGFAVVGVDDFTGDGMPDAVAGVSSEDETEGRARGINGRDGAIEWTYVVTGSSVWAVEQVDDITSDGIRDVIVSGFADGTVYGLDVSNGSWQYSRGGYGLITRFARLDDVNTDGHPDIIPGHSGSTAEVVDGQTGDAIWSTPLADQSATVARIADLTGDGVNDVVVGTLFNNPYGYFLDGADGTVLDSVAYGTPVDGIGAIPDVVGDGSWEMVVGGRNGLVTCYSGGFSPVCIAQDVRSLRLHGLGPLTELSLEMGVSGGVEPREGGIERLEIDLDDASGAMQVVAVDCTPASWSGTLPFAITDKVGNTVTVDFSPALSTKSYCTVELNCGAVVCVRNCEGDLNRSGDTTASDSLQTKIRFGQTATDANCEWDFNLSGEISAADALAIKIRFGFTAPACP